MDPWFSVHLNFLFQVVGSYDRLPDTYFVVANQKDWDYLEITPQRQKDRSSQNENSGEEVKDP